MKKTVLTIIFLSILCAPLVSMADALEPCTSWGADNYRNTVTATIDSPYRDQTLVSFTEFPSFSWEWGIRVVDSEGRMRLRVVEFQESVWYSAYDETESGYFEQDLSKPSYRRLIRETNLSTDTARLLQSIMDREVRDAKEKQGLTMGFDGTSYLFVANDNCAQTWSPEQASRAGKLVQIFYDLRIQAAIPSRFLQLGWERRIHARLLALEGERMSARDYLLFASISLAIMAFAALPLFIATIFALIKPALPRRRWYILSAAALSYGIACIVALPFFVFAFVGDQISSQLGSDGHAIASTGVRWITQAAIPTIFAAWLIAMFLVPTLLKRHWRRMLWPEN